MQRNESQRPSTTNKSKTAVFALERWRQGRCEIIVQQHMQAGGTGKKVNRSRLHGSRMRCAPNGNSGTYSILTEPFDRHGTATRSQRGSAVTAENARRGAGSNAKHEAC